MALCYTRPPECMETEMKHLICAMATSLMLAGCAAGPTWRATGSTDEFTDKTTMMVTTSEYPTSASIVTKPLHLYPVVRREGGEIYVGLMSGGRFKIPVGTVQLRIDQNETWTITPQETPVSLMPAAPLGLPQYGANLPPEQAAMVKQAQDQALLNATQMMSPYTVAGGDKARTILKQMLAGQKLKYRTVGINQAASTTGEVLLDRTLADALRTIGVNPGAL